jgi:hypothetical protein
LLLFFFLPKFFLLFEMMIHLFKVVIAFWFFIICFIIISIWSKSSLLIHGNGSCSSLLAISWCIICLPFTKILVFHIRRHCIIYIIICICFLVERIKIIMIFFSCFYVLWFKIRFFCLLVMRTIRIVWILKWVASLSFLWRYCTLCFILLNNNFCNRLFLTSFLSNYL